MHPNSTDIEKWLKLTGADGVGPVTFGKLFAYFGSPESVLAHRLTNWRRLRG